MTSICVTTFVCLENCRQNVCVKLYTLSQQGQQLHRAVKTIQGLRFEGEWAGDIVYMYPISDDFADQYYRRQLHCYNVTIRALPKVDFQAKQNKYYTAKRVDPASDAWTYFMKFHVFDAYFAAWDRVLYLDSGIAVQKPIQVWYSYAIVTGVITKVRRYLSTHATQNLLTNNVEFIISVCYFHAILKIHLPV
eukprot:m.379999 g.379999  ORF g.379999 m.379999 type:complete len:192 (-) comp20957_c2_seq48:692-1267(-)